MVREIPREENPILLALQDGFIDVEVYLRKLATGEKDETSSIPMHYFDLVHLALRAVAYSQKSSYNLSKELHYYIGTRLSDEEHKALTEYDFAGHTYFLKEAYNDVCHLLKSNTPNDRNECVKSLKRCLEEFRSMPLTVLSEYKPICGYNEALETLVKNLVSYMGYNPEEISKDGTTENRMKEGIRYSMSDAWCDTDWVDVSPEIIYYKGGFYWSGLSDIKDIARKMIFMDRQSGGFKYRTRNGGYRDGIPSKYICELIKGAGCSTDAIRKEILKIREKPNKDSSSKKEKEATP